MTTLTIDYTLRAPTPEEAAPIAAMIIAASLAADGVVDHSVEEQQANWNRRGFTLATDAWLALAPDGALAGYADVWPRERQPGAEQRYYLDAYVHPEHLGRGLGGRLLRQMIARAEALHRAQPPGTPGRMLTSARAADAGARGLFEQAGFAPQAHSWTMRRLLDTPPAPPQWPAGLRVRSFVVGQDEAATHALVQAAFADLSDFVPSTLADWSTRLMDPGLFKPEFWYLACDGDTLAGCALCQSYPEAGWLATLAVSRPYRQRGLATALLHHAFGEFRRTGHPALELGVDSANATGATRVYERAGMHIATAYVTYEKVIGNS
jgi:mycothiol synthase